MSHELRTPLNSIIGFANVLLRNKRQSLRPDELTYLDRIAGSGKHLLGLINDVLDLSKIEAGQMTLETTSVMLDDVVRETLEGFETQAREKGVRLQAVLPARMQPIETDAVRLTQVLINLVGNALKFTERGEVVVAVAVGPDLRPTHLTVRDTGIGIPEERLAAVFNAFEQADSTTTRRFGGTGLGLAISRTLCEALGHHLEAESAVDVGTMMTVRFRAPSGTGIRRTPPGEPAIRQEHERRADADVAA
jgi:signal transduction histidine kinase